MTAWVAYAVAVALTAAAVLLRWVLDPTLAEQLPLVTLYGAIAVSVWFGGLGPALLATGLGYLGCDYLFIDPRGTLGFYAAGHFIGLIAYLVTCSVIIGFGQLMRAAERRAKHEHEKLRVTFASIGDAVITTDPQARITYLNAVAESLTGWAQRDAVGERLESVFRIVNEHTRDPAANPALRALREGVIVGLSNHTVLITKDGSDCPIDDSAAPIKDAEGQILGCVLIFRDITARRAAEEALRQSEERLRLLIDGVRDYALVLLDDAGRVASWNAGAERVKGYMSEEIIGQHFSCFYPSQDIADGKPAQALDAARTTGRFEAQGWRLRSDGSRFWAHVVITPVHDAQGALRGFIKITRDLTESRLTTETLRSVVNNVVDGILTIDQQGIVQSVNPAAEKLFTYKSDEIIGQNVNMLMPAPYCHEHDQYIANYLRTGQAKIIGIGREVVGRRKDGSAFPMELAVGTFVLDERRFFTGIVRDISERKRAAEALQAADRRKEEFLAMLAHELRNPLAPVRNAIKILKLKGPPDPDLAWAREVIDRQVAYMARLLDDLLDVSRISSNKLVLRKESVELTAVVQTAVETSRPLIERDGHGLTVSLPSEPVHVNADPVRLAQVLSNLLNNAAKYTDPGGHIQLTGTKQGDQVLISVKDDGIGIAPDVLPRIFDMFSQGSHPLERAQGGLGIGLSLVRELIGLHGGSVEARSDGLGRGSEFQVRLPLGAQSKNETRQGASEKSEQAGTVKHRLLIADDRKDTVDSLAMLLRIMGHEVQTAYDGQDAIAAAETFRPDVCLIDIGMPKVNGYDVCRHIRQQPWGKDSVLVAMTGWGQEEDKRRAMEAGFDHHILKPADTAELLQLLASGQNSVSIAVREPER
jgi:PAS domain S-box-containing protein